MQWYKWVGAFEYFWCNEVSEWWDWTYHEYNYTLSLVHMQMIVWLLDSWHYIHKMADNRYLRIQHHNPKHTCSDHLCLCVDEFWVFIKFSTRIYEWYSRTPRSVELMRTRTKRTIWGHLQRITLTWIGRICQSMSLSICCQENYFGITRDWKGIAFRTILARVTPLATSFDVRDVVVWIAFQYLCFWVCWIKNICQCSSWLFLSECSSWFFLSDIHEWIWKTRTRVKRTPHPR